MMCEAGDSARTLVVGDIHGACRALRDVLEQAQVAANDTVIFLGDYVDGWSESPQVIDHLIELSTRCHCIFLRGNHEELLLQWLKHGIEDSQWLLYGGAATLKAYRNISAPIRNKHIDFIESLNNYHVDGSNRLFLHAGFTSDNGVESEPVASTIYWDRSMWTMALSLDKSVTPKDPGYPAHLKRYREIYIGHTPTVRIGLTTPVQAANIWNIDTGAAYKGPLTIMDVDSKDFWQSPAVNTLYPAETGRRLR